MMNKRHRRNLIIYGFFALLVFSCTTEATIVPEIETDPVSEEDTGTLTVVPEIEADPVSEEDTVTLTVVYTNDEHGWMAGEEEGQGAAELAGLWTTEYASSDALLVLSGGDNWTGPAISTWFDGESMVEVMNAMGYAASAVGNHEFDFDLDGLQTRTAQADFPYLGANIRYKDNGEIPTDLGIQPYTIVEVAGLEIGLIGLSYQDTPLVTDPTAVAGFDFIDYRDTLREYAPEVRQAGADLVFVITHTCANDLARLAREVEDLGITLPTRWMDP